jgi:hypothetical protein
MRRRQPHPVAAVEVEEKGDGSNAVVLQSAIVAAHREMQQEIRARRLAGPGDDGRRRPCPRWHGTEVRRRKGGGGGRRGAGGGGGRRGAGDGGFTVETSAPPPTAPLPPVARNRGSAEERWREARSRRRRWEARSRRRRIHRGEGGAAAERGG